MLKEWIRNLNSNEYRGGAVIYWMSRDQRVRDNWALIAACHKAKKEDVPMAVVFCLAEGYLGADNRHFSFMIEGLKQVKRQLAEYHIPFYLLKGRAEEEIPAFASAVGAGSIVTDFSPLRLNRQWKNGAAERTSAQFIEVDAHNVVPCFYVSGKKEYGARTIRPKIHRLLPDFLVEFPEIDEVVGLSASAEDIDSVTVGGHGYSILSGSNAAEEHLKTFVDERLRGYAVRRNNPCQDAQSGLSPYFHFGQLAPQRAALAVSRADAPQEDRDAFLEELIVRRELADNFCLYEENYDNIKCADGWARDSLEKHRADMREYVYSYDEFRDAKTHDALWNAAQTELLTDGKIHGYMRMYWAKKILEWTPDAETALSYTLTLNDTLALDGRDPNGYAGAAWSICGVHDRAWFERRIFGKIRYMNYNGCKSKFDVNEYIRVKTQR